MLGPTEVELFCVEHFQDVASFLESSHHHWSLLSSSNCSSNFHIIYSQPFYYPSLLGLFSSTQTKKSRRQSQTVPGTCNGVLVTGIATTRQWNNNKPDCFRFSTRFHFRNGKNVWCAQISMFQKSLGVDLANCNPSCLFVFFACGWDLIITFLVILWEDDNADTPCLTHYSTFLHFRSTWKRHIFRCSSSEVGAHSHVSTPRIVSQIWPGGRIIPAG